MNEILQVLDGFGRSTGDYWSKDNAAFEASNPSIGNRVVRAINPVTGFGSAVGAMRDAAGNGFDPRDTAIALMQALPSFGSVIAKAGVATGAVKDIPIKLVNDYLKTLGSFAASTGLSVAADEAQAKGKK